MSVSSVTSNVLEYKFGYNFGQVFHDYSGNDNHAVNGESSLTTLYDTIPTDRGAHFPSGDSRILLPPNNRNPDQLLLPASFTLISWTLLTSSSPYFIYRYLDTTHFLYIRRNSASGYMIFRAVQGTMDTGEQTGNTNFPLRN